MHRDAVHVASSPADTVCRLRLTLLSGKWRTCRERWTSLGKWAHLKPATLLQPVTSLPAPTPAPYCNTSAVLPQPCI